MPGQETHVREVIDDLLQVKRCSDRPRDLADADELAKINL